MGGSFSRVDPLFLGGLRLARCFYIAIALFLFCDKIRNGTVSYTAPLKPSLGTLVSVRYRVGRASGSNGVVINEGVS